METTNLSLRMGGGGNPYAAPELTVITVFAEQGFAGSGGSGENYESEDMEIQPEEDW